MEETEEKDTGKAEKSSNQGLDNWEEWKENNLEDWQKQRAEKDKKEDKGCRNGCLITIGVIAFLFLTGIVSITTESCDLLPIDIVLFNRFCILTYLVFVLGGPLAIGLGFGLLALIVNGIERIFKKK